jgi:hypothetical protein
MVNIFIAAILESFDSASDEVNQGCDFIIYIF